jgi:hypothetical protein
MIFRRIEMLEQPEAAGSSNNGGRNSKGAQDGETSTQGSTQSPDDGSFLSEAEEDESSDDEISEYKRIRLLDHGGNRWKPCQGLRISRTGLSISYPARGPQTSREYVVARATRPMWGRGTTTLREHAAAYFEIKVLSGDVRVGCYSNEIAGSAVFYNGDGDIRHGTRPFPRHRGPAFGQGDIIGCAFYEHKACFTRNGRIIGK